MQGIFLNNSRPKSKKEIREAIALDPSTVTIEATSMFGDEFDGMADALPVGSKPVLFVGPDPYTSRKFYGKLTRTSAGFKVS